MKIILPVIPVLILILFLCACGGQGALEEKAAPGGSEYSDEYSFRPNEADSSHDEMQGRTCGRGYSPSPAPSEKDESGEALLSVTWGDKQLIYALNDSPAAAALLEQLPLTVQVEDYSSNEKIFYPPQKLDISDSPAASGGSGTLAYYAPWGDIVMFYGDFDENPSLYELGRIVSGEELLSQLDGSITIEAA